MRSCYPPPGIGAGGGEWRVPSRCQRAEDPNSLPINTQPKSMDVRGTASSIVPSSTAQPTVKTFQGSPTGAAGIDGAADDGVASARAWGTTTALAAATTVDSAAGSARHDHALLSPQHHTRNGKRQASVSRRRHRRQSAVCDVLRVNGWSIPKHSAFCSAAHSLWCVGCSACRGVCGVASPSHTFNLPLRHQDASAVDGTATAAEAARSDRRKAKKLRKRAAQGTVVTLPKGVSHQEAMAALYGPLVRCCFCLSARHGGARPRQCTTPVCPPVVHVSSTMMAMMPGVPPAGGHVNVPGQHSTPGVCACGGMFSIQARV